MLYNIEVGIEGNAVGDWGDPEKGAIINRPYQWSAQKQGWQIWVLVRPHHIVRLQTIQDSKSIRNWQNVVPGRHPAGGYPGYPGEKKKNQITNLKVLPLRQSRGRPQQYALTYAEFFNPRSNPDFTEDNTSIRYNTWYLFGVDYMSNERIRNYFHTNPHFKI